ncbi:MAG: hypothetical protein DRH57_05585 [Candidatus Cloacimonadota bacterium]|nr:MAG: hypothetical protein DRH57_05585 [Candidatus Cloacimonadota bacterium]
MQKNKGKTRYEEFIIKLSEEEIEDLKKMFKTKSAKRAVEKAVKDIIADEIAYESIRDMQGVGGVKAIYD